MELWEYKFNGLEDDPMYSGTWTFHTTNSIIQGSAIHVGTFYPDGSSFDTATGYVADRVTCKDSSTASAYVVPALCIPTPPPALCVPTPPPAPCVPTPPPAPCVPPTPSAFATQEGGGHYTSMKIQPFEFSMANKLDPMQHTIVKYVTRFRAKNGLEDLRKARHTLDMLIEWEIKNAIQAK